MSSSPTVKVDNVILEAVEHFCYLGSMLSTNVNANIDISTQIAKAISRFGRLSKTLKWSRDMARHKSNSVQGCCPVSPVVWLWVLHTVSPTYQKTRPVPYESLSTCNIKWQDKISIESAAETPNHQHRSIPAKWTTPMDWTCHTDGQQPSGQDDILQPTAARTALTRWSVQAVQGCA